jgi:excisionase family DNA binding protein
MVTEAEEEFLTVAEAAQRLKVHPETLRTWLKQGKLKGNRPGSKQLGWRIPRSAVERFLAGD